MNGRNAGSEEAPLFVIADAESGDHLTLRMLIFANKDFVRDDQIDSIAIPAAAEGRAPLSRAKLAIMRRLALKKIGGPGDNGEIALCITDNIVK